jgi:2-hydroxy-6-oxonona-2,4-dienedioate hydrolase
MTDLAATNDLTGTDGHRSFWTDLFGFSYTIGWLDAEGIRTRYLEAGDPGRPTVVMLHGIGGSLELFVANIGPLSEHFHVLAFDFVGFGLTDKAEHDLEIPDYVEHLEAVLAAKGLSRVMLFAVSLGSWVSVTFASKHPGQVERMILAAPAGLLPPTEAGARFMQQQAYETVDNPTWDRLNQTFDHLVYDPASKLPDALAVRRAIALQPGMPASTRHIMSVLDPAAVERNQLAAEAYRNLTAPVLFLECPDTVDLSFHMIQQARGLIPNCEVISVPRAAHWPHFEEPGIVNPAAIRFLKGEVAAQP